MTASGHPSPTAVRPGGPTLQNNFDLIRLVLAILVVLQHAAIVHDGFRNYLPFNLGRVAVDAFFFVSGFLITWSFMAEPRPGPYSVKRFFRVYPLFLLVLAAQFLILLHMNTAPLSLHEIGRYLVANLLFLNFLAPEFGNGLDPFLGGEGHTINGSLWTLKIEAGFYVILPFVVLYLYRRFGARAFWALIVLSTLFSLAATFAGVKDLGRQLPGKLNLFFLGSLLYLGFERARALLEPLGRRVLVLLLGALVVVGYTWIDIARGFGTASWSLAYLAYLALLPLATFAAAFHLPVLRVRRDLSYGIYLWHYPLCHLLYYQGLFRESFYLYLAAVLLLTVAVSYVSSYLIEVPGIRFGRRLAKSLGARQPAARLAPAERSSAAGGG